MLTTSTSGLRDSDRMADPPIFYRLPHERKMKQDGGNLCIIGGLNGVDGDRPEFS
jgi:hypothetical protein